MPEIEQGKVISVRAASVYELTRDIWDTNKIDKEKWDKLGRGWQVTLGEGFLMQNEEALYRVTLVSEDQLTILKYGKNKNNSQVAISTDPSKGVIESLGQTKMTEKEIDLVLTSLCHAVRFLQIELSQAMAAN